MKKLRKVIMLSFVLFTCLIFVGCGSNQSKISDKIDNSLNNLSNILKGTDTLVSTELVISEIMDENEIAILTSVPNSNKQIVRYDNNKTGYNGATFTSANVYQGRYINTDEQFKYNALTGYVAKLEQLHDIASDTISANNCAKYLKTTLNSKISAVKSINSQIENGNIELNNQQCKAVEDLLTNLNMNANRINFSKNELSNEAKAVKNLKNNYANNIEQLNSKYTKLLNCLDTRCSYYSNCLGCLDGIYNCILNGNINIQDILNYNNCANCVEEDNYLNNCPECTNQNDVNQNDINENDINQTMSNNYNNYQTNYRNQYTNNPYYMYDMYNNGYTRYWGNNYYPRNINTFGGYRNINTYGENFAQNGNVNTYKELSSNVDTYKKSNTKKQVKDDTLTPNNNADPYKILPTNLDDKNIQTNIQNNNNLDNKSTYEFKELYYSSNKNSPVKNKGFFRVYKVEDGKVTLDETKEFDINDAEIVKSEEETLKPIPDNNIVDGENTKSQDGINEKINIIA